MYSGNEQIQFFEQILFIHLGKDTPIKSLDFVSGGCINNAVRLQTTEGDFFVKWNVQELDGMFEAEARGLQILKQSGEIYVPEVLATGKQEDKAYILMEYISSTLPHNDFWEDFGRSMAYLHKHSQTYFGLDFNNYIGSLPQNNEPMGDGLAFFIEKRLRVQAGLAYYQGHIDRDLLDQLSRFYDLLPDLLPISEKPALLHGDLWSGNFLVNELGKATLIDPATYYGWREAELAFTRLFGGFESRFYEAYQEVYPLEKDFEKRVEIYNLYPLLVHLNLFGSSYREMIERIIKKFLN